MARSPGLPLVCLLTLALAGCAPPPDPAPDPRFGAIPHPAVGLPFPRATLPTDGEPTDCIARPLPKPLVVAVLDDAVPPALTDLATDAEVIVLRGPAVEAPLRRLTSDEAAVREALALDETPGALLVSTRGLIVGAYRLADLAKLRADLGRLATADPVELVGQLRLATRTGGETKAGPGAAAAVLTGAPMEPVPVPLSGSAYVPTRRTFQEVVFQPTARRAVVEGYAAHGNRDPRWDQPALAQLERWATDEPLLVGQPTDELLEAANDPYLFFLRGGERVEQGDPAGALAWYRRAAARAEELDIPVLGRYWLIATLYGQALRGGVPVPADELASIRERTLAAVAELACSSPSADEMANTWHWLERISPELGAEGLVRIESLLDQKPDDAQPWFRAMVRANVAMAREEPAAPEPAAEPELPPAMNPFALGPAAGAAAEAPTADPIREPLLEAWALAPAYPWAATALIHYSRDEPIAGAGPRRWFDRATRAQLNHWPAYGVYRAALLPSQVGSPEPMLAFGDECLATERYDIWVPHQYYSALNRLQHDGATEVWERNEVYPKVLEVFREEMALKPDPGEERSLRRQMMVFAWRCGKLAMAREQLRVLGDRADMPRFEETFAVSFEQIRGELAAD